MSEEWQYQVRINFPPATAELARRDVGAPELRPLAAILARHQATLTCQFDAFAALKPSAKALGITHSANGPRKPSRILRRKRSICRCSLFTSRDMRSTRRREPTRA